MPIPFENCIKNHGRVRTKDLPNGKYIHICFLNGKSYAGEVKKKLAKDVAKTKYIKMIKGR